MKKLLFLLSVMFLLASDMWAQGCVTCTQTAAGLGASSAQGLNDGIIYLAALPLIFLATIGFIWYKRNKETSAHSE